MGPIRTTTSKKRQSSACWHVQSCTIITHTLQQPARNANPWHAGMYNHVRLSPIRYNNQQETSILGMLACTTMYDYHPYVTTTSKKRQSSACWHVQPCTIITHTLQQPARNANPRHAGMYNHVRLSPIRYNNQQET